MITLCIVVTAFSQERAFADKSLRDYAVKKEIPLLESNLFESQNTPIVKTANLTTEETTVGITRYDDQANASCQNRIYLYDDGTIGVTWIFGLNDPGYDDRGAGYNYFDGNTWDSHPTARLEDERCGWPSYAPWGENGEVVVSHTGADGYKISTREEKGTGDWNYSLLPGPTGHEYVIWNRSVTSGVDHNRMHVLSLTASTAYAGTPYEGLNGALLYSYSSDGGATWEMENEILDGMTSDDYYGFTSDNYTFAEPKDDIVAFIVGESWFDMFLMKSTDGGQTFTKTMIWEHPYPLFDYVTPSATDTFYCADGAHHAAIDNNGKVHVVFGINRSYADDGGTYWFPYVDGIGYWNEDMPAFSDDLNALNPYDDAPYSELVEDYNLIGWSQDVDGDGELTFAAEIGTYYLGLSSMPQIVIDDVNTMYLVYSSTTETFDNGATNYRHLWARVSPFGTGFWGTFHDLTSDLIHIFDECVYPSCAANSDDNIYLVYQQDNEPGNAVWGQQHDPVDNDMVVMQVNKDDITSDIKDVEYIHNYDVSQNVPNPFSTTSTINVNLRRSAELQLVVVNLVGQVMYQEVVDAKPGMNKFVVDASEFSNGIYFYTIKAGTSSVTKKMIVE